MPHTRKIATCCYCGTRAALVLTGKVRHELACATCGAPLHELKQLPVDGPARPAVGRAGIAALAAGVRARRRTAETPRKLAKRTKRRKMSLERLWDEIEDIFD